MNLDKDTLAKFDDDLKIINAMREAMPEDYTTQDLLRLINFIVYKAMEEDLDQLVICMELLLETAKDLRAVMNAMKETPH